MGEGTPSIYYGEANAAEGMSTEEILAAYPDLEREDIAESLRYAAEAVRERELSLSPRRRRSFRLTSS